MSDIIKTWPAFIEPYTVMRMFGKDSPYARYYFTLGRGKPQREIKRLWFSYRGRILGCFTVEEIVRNDGANIPRLRSCDGSRSEWQIKKDAYVAVCIGPCDRLRERLYMTGFRGWRYFNISTYRESSEAKVRL